MEQTITIPSPSVFLRASPTPPSPPDEQPSQDAPSSRKSTKKKKASAAQTVARRSNNKSVLTGTAERPRMTKSRDGCMNCKEKRLKCDETKPHCNQCEKRGKASSCEYKKILKWVDYGQQQDPARNVHAFRPRQGADRVKAPIPQQAAAPNTQVKSKPKTLHDSASPDIPSQQHSDHPVDQALFPQISGWSSGSTSVATPGAIESSSATGSTPDIFDMSSLQQPPSSHPTDIDTVSAGFPFMDSERERSPQMQSPPGDTIDPRTLPDALGLPEDDWMATAEMPDVDDQTSPDHGDDVEDIPREDQQLVRHDQLTSSRAAELASVSSARGHPAFIINMYSRSIPSEPLFSPDTIEMVTMRFHHMTCGILSVNDGQTENPWRSHIWPMAQSSEALYNALCAMSAFHAARDTPVLKHIGVRHYGESMPNLREGVRDGSMTTETALATSLALGFAEGWLQHTTNVNHHIKGGYMTMKMALAEHQANPRTGPQLARLKFLCNAWVYMDVISRITSVDDDETDEYDEIFANFDKPTFDDDGFGLNFGMQLDARLDPLMGCASTLFPLIGKVANLVRRVWRAPTRSPAIISQAVNLKNMIEDWRPPDFIEKPEDSSIKVQDSLQTAEAYRWAILLHLHQTVPEIPSPTSSQLAAKVLAYLATVQPSSRFLIVHIFPLMSAGCEAFTADDRQWVRDRWLDLDRRLRIGSIKKCIEITEEVWRRRDHQYNHPRRSWVPTGNPHNSNFPPHQMSNGGMPTRFEPLDFDIGDPNLGVFNAAAGSLAAMQQMDFSTMLFQQPQMNECEEYVNGHYNIKGNLHWLGVMKDWNWEVLLG